MDPSVRLRQQMYSKDGRIRSTSTSWFPSVRWSFDDAGLNELDCAHNTPLTSGTAAEVGTGSCLLSIDKAES